MPEVEIAQLSDGQGGTATYYLTYDAALKVTRFRCDNRGAGGAFGELVQRDAVDRSRDGLKCRGDFRPGTDTKLPVPTVWADRLQLTREPDGDLTGVDMDLGTEEAPRAGARAAADDGLPRSVRGPLRIKAAAAGGHGD